MSTEFRQFRRDLRGIVESVCGRTALILGAYSEIGIALGRELARRGHELFLVGRSQARLESLVREYAEEGLGVRGVRAVDLIDLEAVSALFDDVAGAGLVADVVVVGHGMHRSNEECAASLEQFRRMIDTNFTSAALCAELAARLFDPQAGGELVVISSVSGDRARARNYGYGASKAGLDAFLCGLRLVLATRGINVMILKPGPMKSGVYADVPGQVPRADPAMVARIACDAIGRGRCRVYAPRVWRYLMWFVRALPESVLARGWI